MKFSSWPPKGALSRALSLSVRVRVCVSFVRYLPTMYMRSVVKTWEDVKPFPFYLFPHPSTPMINNRVSSPSLSVTGRTFPACIPRSHLVIRVNCSKKAWKATNTASLTEVFSLCNYCNPNIGALTMFFLRWCLPAISKFLGGSKWLRGSLLLGGLRAFLKTFETHSIRKQHFESHKLSHTPIPGNSETLWKPIQRPTRDGGMPEAVVCTQPTPRLIEPPSREGPLQPLLLSGHRQGWSEGNGAAGQGSRHQRAVWSKEWMDHFLTPQ